ncbi:MAG: TonB-dependent receptor [Acidobacteria bacterium]|nr:TonB-dependent receptor [Acidobacteriota bacterium]
MEKNLVIDSRCLMSAFPAVVLLIAGMPVVLSAAQAVPEATAGDATSPAHDTEAAEVSSSEETTLGYFSGETTVTATGTESESFDIAIPVTVLTRERIEREAPANAAELLRFEPGVDVNGVGPNQSRPIIRGLRGLRILFLENGLRMNNARRQTDFGEIPALVDLESVETIEIVRGPASVLYGSDAIGGVLNLLTKRPLLSAGSGLVGTAVARYGSAGEATRLEASLTRQSDRNSFRLGGSIRDASDYEAPSGSFGEIELATATDVVDTGLEDNSVFAVASRALTDGQELFVRWNRYRAKNAGFGFVEPDLLGDAQAFRIRIQYPFQDFDRFTVGYQGSDLDSVLADSVEVQTYYQKNKRELVNDIDINIGPIAPGFPDSSVAADTRNFTDLTSYGLRTEILKAVHEKHRVTYGIEWWTDDSVNTDRSVTTTTLRFPGPPFAVEFASIDEVANAPNAKNQSLGLFAQGELALADRATLTLGARYQTVETRANPTPNWDITGLDFEDDSLIGALSFIYRVSDQWRVSASYGSAFRAPNIVERLFNGLTPEGAGFQILNPDLISEESDNIDFGIKFRNRKALVELFAFRNDINDGIIQYFLGPTEIATLPQATQDEIRDTGVRFVVQQRNIDRLRYQGLELRVDTRPSDGWHLGGNLTHLEGERLDSTNPPTGDTVADKLNFYMRWAPTGRDYWLEYRLRHNGDQRANLDPGEPVPPVGEILPSFSIHSLSGGWTFKSGAAGEHRLGLILDNLTDELYAEFSNATFFRPQPGRNATLTYRLRY